MDTNFGFLQNMSIDVRIHQRYKNFLRKKVVGKIITVSWNCLFLTAHKFDSAYEKRAIEILLKLYFIILFKVFAL